MEAKKKISIRLTFHLPHRLRRRLQWLKHHQPAYARGKRGLLLAASLVLILTLLLNVVLPYFGNRWQNSAYALTGVDKSVISQQNATMASALQHNEATQTYNFNSNYVVPDAGNQVSAGGPQIKATLHDDLSKGVTITDPNTSDSFTITPQDKALPAQQSGNQIQYPIDLGSASMIYTANAIGVKEDILLRHEMGNRLKFDYKLGLGSDYAAKVLSDGSLAIYGSSDTSLTNATAGDAKDQALLDKARANAPKDTWLFTIPPPTIHAAGNNLGNAKASYSLKGDILTITATNLKQADYPLSIDPTVQISTTSEFYRSTSIESNADFDVTNNQITRGALTGGTTGTWTATTTMNQARFLAGAVAYNGYMYVVGGASTSASTTNLAGNNANMVEYASISTANPSVLGTWTAGNNNGLPAGGLSRFQLIGYHGFIYAIGGSTTDTTCTTESSTVYYAAVQVNGVLGNWATTNAPATARCDFGAAAYGGKIYIAGGKTGAAATTGSTDVSYALVNPDGTLTWTSGTTPALPAARYGADLQAYNGYLYLVGGNLNGTLTNTVLYNALNTNGTIYNGSSNWTSTNTFATARENLGAVFSVIKNGYIYLSGGCTTLNANQSCTAPQSDTQLAQINADGSLGQWATTTSLTANRVGATEVVWRGTVYNIAGCLAMATATISCNTAPVATTQYGTITTAGQASVLKTSTTYSPVYPLSIFGASAAVLNGYLYVVGGCTTNDCQSGAPSVTNQTYYSKIAADGTLGTWGNVAANTINGTGTTSGIAEMGLVAANGTLYGFGGYNDNAPSQSAWIVTPSPTTGALPGAWTQSTGNLAATVYADGVIYVKGTFIVIGGCIAANGTFGCSTYRTAVTKYTISGTTLTNAGAMTNALPTTANYSDAAFGLAYYYGYMYACGGTDAGQAYTQYCTYSKLNTTTMDDSAWALTTGKFNTTTSPQHPIRRSSAYASNGYLYVFAGHDGLNLAPVGTINIGKIDPATGNVLTDFTVSTTAFTPKWDTASAFADGNVYTVGGCTAGNPPTSCTARSNAVEYFQIYNATNSGNRAITTSGNSPTAAPAGNSTVAYNGYLYTTGGCSAYAVATTTCTTAVGTSYFAPINPDGSIGTWTAGPSLPTAVGAGLRGFGCMVALNGTLYYMGGETSGGTAETTVYYSSATGASWGSGTWTAATDGLLAAKSGLSCSTWNDRIYATGGSTSTTTYFSPTLASGGNITAVWTATTDTFTTARSYHATVAVGGYLYVIGGFDGTNYLSDVQFAQIATSGNITTAWTYTNDLPYKERQMSAFAANGYIYVLGGANGTTSTSCIDDQNVASVNSDGTLGAWQQGVATSFTAVLGEGVGYYNGYYYVVGGNNCTANVTTVAYAGEQSQAIRSIFTRYIDLVGDATPWKFVVGGNDALVNTVDIDQWSMTYSSSRISANAFGASQTLSPLQFGPNPVAITAIDASSTNQGVGRYWLMAFSIDQTDSFTFADADTALPAITSYSFYYAPSGNTRLRNGGIFQDQTSQSLDAHP